MSCRTKTLYVLMYIAKSDTDLKKNVFNIVYLYGAGEDVQRKWG